MMGSHRPVCLAHMYVKARNQVNELHGKKMILHDLPVTEVEVIFANQDEFLLSVDGECHI